VQGKKCFTWKFLSRPRSGLIVCLVSESILLSRKSDGEVVIKADREVGGRQFYEARMEFDPY
jgi:hypothetical protein